MQEPAEAEQIEQDKKLLNSMGYAQELLRRMRSFQNFAISFSIICILSGGINSFSQGLSSVGGAAIGIGWPLVCCISLLFALAMGQIASAYPTAGGLYHWASILGGRTLGWVTAWCNLFGLITVLGAINVGTYLFLVGALGPYIGIDAAVVLPAQPTVTSVLIQTAVVGVITLSQALINHLGIRLTSKLTDFSGYLILFTSIALAVALLAYAPSINASRLGTFHNFSGDAGGGVWPQTGNIGYLFLLSFLLPAYTITGFDASAHTAEETIDAAKAVPRGMLHSVFWSGLFGWIMLSAIILAAPNLGEAASKGGGSFFWIMDQVLPVPLKVALFALIALAQYLCGLATVTSASRMVFAFSRDGGLPFSDRLRTVSARYRTPVAATWTAAVLALAFTTYAPVYTTIAAVCVMFLYFSYLLPVAAGLFAYKKSWTNFGPFGLGPWFRVVAVLCVAGCLVLIYIGVQPPNDKALTVIVAAGVVLAIAWFASERRRFEGPPVGRITGEQIKEIEEAERLVGERPLVAPAGP